MGVIGGLIVAFSCGYTAYDLTIKSYTYLKFRRDLKIILQEYADEKIKLKNAVRNDRIINPIKKDGEKSSSWLDLTRVD